MNQTLLPKYHILNISELEEFQCTICYSAETEIVRCKGPCKKIFCLHCVTRFKVKSPLCPNRCSNPCQLEQVPNFQMHFKCPYDCKSVLKGTQQFRVHCQSCELISKEIKEEMTRNKEFLCPKNHRLLFLNQDTFHRLYDKADFYATTLNETCSLCNCQTVCTSICQQCSTPEKKIVFCIKCRALPCTKIQCPVGHQYAKRNVTSGSTICDFCGLAISIFGSQSFRDDHCNFDICLKCHKNLPQVHPLVPLKQFSSKKKSSLFDQFFNWGFFNHHGHINAGLPGGEEVPIANNLNENEPDLEEGFESQDSDEP